MAHDTNTKETFYNMLSYSHVDELEVPAKDLSIWKHAKEHDLIILPHSCLSVFQRACPVK
jgi:predicted nuclease of predicted toxin-antitoxin system